MLEWPESCPGGCGAPVTYGLSRAGKALRTCKCRDTIGRRNRRKGQKAQAVMHRALGGTGLTPSHEETARPYDLSVMPESKTGGQIPASWDKFEESVFFVQAMKQNRLGIPVGMKPSVCIRGRWLVVDLKVALHG